MGPQLVQWLKVCRQAGSTQHAPHVAGAMIVRCHYQGAVQSNSQAAHRSADLAGGVLAVNGDTVSLPCDSVI